MREFIENLFEKKNEIEFQYENYEMSFFAGRFKSYYLIFYITTQEELIGLWKKTSSIFKTIKQNEDIYNNSMEKNIVCIYCLNAVSYTHLDVYKRQVSNYRSENASSSDSVDQRSVPDELSGRYSFSAAAE